jgi:uncharacterized glyoxalase superfamily protein PhnB
VARAGYAARMTPNVFPVLRYKDAGTYEMGAQPGEPNIFPELRCPSGPRAIAWLRDAFGFEPVIDVPGPEGTTAHAELRLGDSYVMLATADVGGSAWGDQDHAVSVHVDNPDAVFTRATTAGAAVDSSEIESRLVGTSGQVRPRCRRLHHDQRHGPQIRR